MFHLININIKFPFLCQIKSQVYTLGYTPLAKIINKLHTNTSQLDTFGSHLVLNSRQCHFAKKMFHKFVYFFILQKMSSSAVRGTYTIPIIPTTFFHEEENESDKIKRSLVMDFCSEFLYYAVNRDYAWFEESPCEVSTLCSRYKNLNFN